MMLHVCSNDSPCCTCKCCNPCIDDCCPALMGECDCSGCACCKCEGREVEKEKKKEYKEKYGDVLQRGTKKYGKENLERRLYIKK